MAIEFLQNKEISGGGKNNRRKEIGVAASIAFSIRHKFEPDFPCLSHSFMFALFRCSLI